MMKTRIPLLWTILSLFLWGCASPPVGISPTLPPEETLPVTGSTPTETTIIEPTAFIETAIPNQTATSTVIPPEEVTTSSLADVISVRINGNENSYQFAVEIRSPDEGCQQYADWWEVITEDGTLIYRRILTHSHVNEQPFSRSGGPVAVSADTIVIVRAHLHPDGYGGAALRGSAQAGFEPFQLKADFAEGLEKVDPLPDGCAF